MGDKINDSGNSNDPRIPCKYGSKCYQKNPAHHEKYKHPPKREKPKSPDSQRPAKRPKVFDTSDSTRSSKKKEATEVVGTQLEDNVQEIEEKKIDQDTSTKESNTQETGISSEIQEECNANQFIQEKFLVTMPDDFYQFWNFCQSLNQKDPCNALKDIGLTLVGPYDVLAGKFFGIKQKKSEDYLIHWRYYRDPPEFQTVLKGNNNTGYHIGYFRDSPDEMPVFLAYNKEKENGVFKKMGENIFAAVNFYLEDLKKTGDPFKKMHIGKIQTLLKKEADKLELDLSQKTEKMLARDKKVVARSFNKLGLVVPYDRKTQLGYRELALSNKEILNLFNKLEKALPDQKTRILSELQPMFTFASIAADECDFGTGIELGLNIIAHGVDGLNNTAMRFLASNYRLLKREAFATISEAHMKNRKKGYDLSIL